MATLSYVREQANAELAAGHYERAISLAQLIQRRFPQDYQAHRLLGRISLETQEVEAAREAFETVIGLDPEDIVSRSALAIIAEIQGDLEGALAHFERALDIDPDNREIASEVARLSSALGRTERAEAGSSAHSMARLCLAQQEYGDAVTWFEEARRTAPHVPEVALGLARALWLDWRPREAEGIAREVLAEIPNCLPALAIVGAAIQASGSEESLDYLARTAELDPGNRVARALFADAGRRFPAFEEDLDIPDSELEAALTVSDAEDLTAEEPRAEETVEADEAVPEPEEAAPEPEMAAPELEMAAPEPDEAVPEPEMVLEVSDAAIGPEDEDEESAPPEDGDDESALLEDGEDDPTQADVEVEPSVPEDFDETVASPVEEVQPEEIALDEGIVDQMVEPTPVEEEIDPGSDGQTEPDTESDEGLPSIIEGMIGASEVAAERAERTAGYGGDSSDSENGDAEPAREPSAADHMAAAAGCARRGLSEMALSEYRAALEKDISLAVEVGEAVSALADASPGNPRIRWLAGDAFTRAGRFNRAVEQYMIVLKKDG